MQDNNDSAFYKVSGDGQEDLRSEKILEWIQQQVQGHHVFLLNTEQTSTQDGKDL